jgi:hypothetical protein
MLNYSVVFLTFVLKFGIWQFFQAMFTRLPVLNDIFLFKFCFVLDFKC